MIPRYTRPEMAAIWEPQTRFRIWFEIEAHAADAMAELGIIPKEAAKTIWAKGKNATFDVARIDEIEREVKHDVIAFLTHLAEIVGPEARFVHAGMTSSDVLDTCFNVQLKRAADILIADLDKLLAALKRRALEHKMTPTIGRSHGIHAEPVTFGLKLAYAYAEFSRARERLVAARKEIATCAISGAVGTFAQIDPRVEEHVAKAINSAVFPGIQGGPLMHVIAAKAVAFKEALDPSFKRYQEQVVKNAETLAKTLVQRGLRIVSGRTESHVMLVDLRPKGITGKDADAALGRANITVNKNAVPGDPRPPMVTSGLRMGTPAITTRAPRSHRIFPANAPEMLPARSSTSSPSRAPVAMRRI